MYCGKISTGVGLYLHISVYVLKMMVKVVEASSVALFQNSCGTAEEIPKVPS